MDSPSSGKISAQFDCCRSFRCPRGWKIEKKICVPRSLCGGNSDIPEYEIPDYDSGSKGLVRKHRYNYTDKHKVAIYSCDNLKVKYALITNREGTASLCFFGQLRIFNSGSDEICPEAELKVKVKHNRSEDTWATMDSPLPPNAKIPSGHSEEYSICGCIDLTSQMKCKLKDGATVYLEARVCASGDPCVIAKCCLSTKKENKENIVSILDCNPVAGRWCVDSKDPSDRVNIPGTTYHKIIYTDEQISERCGGGDRGKCEGGGRGEGGDRGKCEGEGRNEEFPCDSGGPKCAIGSSKACLKIASRFPKIQMKCKTRRCEWWCLSKCSQLLPVTSKPCSGKPCSDKSADQPPPIEYIVRADKMKDDCNLKYQFCVYWECGPRPNYDKDFIIVVSAGGKGDCSSDDSDEDDSVHSEEIKDILNHYGPSGSPKRDPYEPPVGINVFKVNSSEFQCHPFVGSGCFKGFTKKHNHGTLHIRIYWLPETYNLCKDSTSPGTSPGTSHKCDSWCCIELQDQYLIRPSISWFRDQLSLTGMGTLKVLNLYSTIPVWGSLLTPDGKPDPHGLRADLTGKDTFELKYVLSLKGCGKVVLENCAQLLNRERSCYGDDNNDHEDLEENRILFDRYVDGELGEEGLEILSEPILVAYDSEYKAIKPAPKRHISIQLVSAQTKDLFRCVGSGDYSEPRNIRIIDRPTTTPTLEPAHCRKDPKSGPKEHHQRTNNQAHQSSYFTNGPIRSQRRNK